MIAHWYFTYIMHAIQVPWTFPDGKEIEMTLEALAIANSFSDFDSDGKTAVDTNPLVFLDILTGKSPLERVAQ